MTFLTIDQKYEEKWHSQQKDKTLGAILWFSDFVTQMTNPDKLRNSGHDIEGYSQRVTWVAFAILAMFNRHLWNVTLTVSKVKGQNLWKVVFVKVNALNEISCILLPDIIPPLEVGVVLNLQPSRSRPHMCLHLSPRCAYHRSVGVGDRVTLYLAPGKWSRPRENPRSGVNKEAEHVEEAELWSVA